MLLPTTSGYPYISFASMPTSPTPSDQPESSQGLTGGPRESVGSGSNTAGASSALVRSAFAPDLPCLRAVPTPRTPQAGSTSRRAGHEKKNAGTAPATDVAERPVTQTRQLSSSAAPSVTEVELLDEDRAIVDAAGAQRADQTL